MSDRLQNLLVAVLLLVALGGLYLGLSGDQEGGARTVTSPGEDDSAATTPRPSSVAPESARSDTKARDDARTATAGPVKADQPPTLAEAVQGSTDEAVTVWLLGDDTSNTRGEWVHEWGLLAADDRPVSVVHWDEMGDISYTDPDELSDTGPGTPLTIWSASRTGADVPSAISRLSLLLPEEGEPDAVILNFGVNDTDAIAGDLDDLLGDLRDEAGDVPVGIVRQPDGVSRDAVTEAVETWSRRNDVMLLDASDQDSPEDWAQTVRQLLEP